MALFKSFCEVCGNERTDNTLEIGGVYVCSYCYDKTYFSSPPYSLTIGKLKQHINYREDNARRFNSFVPQNELNLDLYTIVYNDEMRQFYFMNAAQRRVFRERGAFIGVPIPYLYSYDSIINYQYYENDSQVVTQEGAGKAIGGALLFGITGAIVGNAMRKESTQTLITNMRVTVMLDNPYQETAEFLFHGSGVTYGSASYVKQRSQADQLIELLNHMTGNENPDSDSKEPLPDQVSSTSPTKEALKLNQASSTSPTDEIMKLKNLLDQGIITNEEFSAMKQKLIDQL